MANNQSLREVDDSWPAVLKQLRRSFDMQITAITSKAEASGKQLLQSQQASILQLSKDRGAKGDKDGAHRAELIATALVQLAVRPTIEALKETGGKLCILDTEAMACGRRGTNGRRLRGFILSVMPFMAGYFLFLCSIKSLKSLSLYSGASAS